MSYTDQRTAVDTTRKDMIRGRLTHDQAVESWLREQVVSTARELEESPEDALSASQIKELLAARRRSRSDSDNQ